MFCCVLLCCVFLTSSAWHFSDVSFWDLPSVWATPSLVACISYWSVPQLRERHNKPDIRQISEQYFLLCCYKVWTARNICTELSRHQCRRPRWTAFADNTYSVFPEGLWKYVSETYKSLAFGAETDPLLGADVPVSIESMNRRHREWSAAQGWPRHEYGEGLVFNPLISTELVTSSEKGTNSCANRRVFPIHLKTGGMWVLLKTGGTWLF